MYPKQLQKHRWLIAAAIICALAAQAKAATQLWVGGAAPITQVTTITAGGTIASGSSTWTVTIGSKSIVTVGGSTTAATVATNIVTAINALTSTLYPEFSSITWATTSGGAFTATAKTSGVPFTVGLATTDSTGTFTQSATVAATGPNFWNNASNWSTGGAPASGDDVFIQNSAVPIIYGLSNAAVLLNSLTIDQSYTGTIGLPVTNSAGYPEYRTQYLLIGQQGAFTTTIGRGIGAGSGRIKINYGSTKTFCTVLNSGSPVEAALPAVILLGTNSSNTLTVEKGSVGMALFAGDTSTLAALNVGYVTSETSDSNVKMGTGVTLSSCAIVKTGGSLELNSTFNTLVDQGGTTTIIGIAASTSITANGGTIINQSSGTHAAVTVGNGGVMDCSQDLQAKTFTNTTLNFGATLLDPGKKITFTNPMLYTAPLSGNAGSGIKVDFGPSFSLQRT